jgi:hypothetical protein
MCDENRHYLEYDKDGEQSEASNHWEHHGLSGRHSLNLFTRVLFHKFLKKKYYNQLRFIFW